MWCGVHPTLCPRRTRPRTVFMSHGAEPLTGPECSWPVSSVLLSDQAHDSRARRHPEVLSLSIIECQNIISTRSRRVLTPEARIPPFRSGPTGITADSRTRAARSGGKSGARPKC
ncbi:hypothetical protein FM103_11660 [Corynebacterium xerosis]|nr:hypothetical protein FM103_11660 [Corynebacterium xerosis]